MLTGSNGGKAIVADIKIDDSIKDDFYASLDNMGIKLTDRVQDVLSKLAPVVAGSMGMNFSSENMTDAIDSIGGSSKKKQVGM